MITKIISKKVELPPIFLVENEEDFKELPLGLPYIIGTQADLPFIRIFLEFQVLLKSCMRTGLAVKWLDCLKRIGYGSRMKEYTLSSGGDYFASSKGGGAKLSIDEFVEDQYFVNFDKLSELRILPKWLDDLRASVETNIIDEVTFDPTCYNKQLKMNTGGPAIKHNLRNLLILDVSSSMPTSVVVSITNLAKLMSKKFYADIIVTGGQSFFIDYDKVIHTDIVEQARIAGRSNESEMFRAIVADTKEYNTVISFGDNDSPGPEHHNSNSKGCNFKCETLFSLHVDKGSSNVTGYAKWLKPKTTHIVKDWVDTIK